jgi:hypothetical protein
MFLRLPRRGTVSDRAHRATVPVYGISIAASGVIATALQKRRSYRAVATAHTTITRQRSSPLKRFFREAELPASPDVRAGHRAWKAGTTSMDPNACLEVAPESRQGLPGSMKWIGSALLPGA